jgi:tetrahydromethanopterin S-methyltransferase subunit G
MVVMAPREKWTDERLDDLNRKVDDVRTEMREGFAHMNARFDGLNRNLLVIAGAIIAALIGSSVALIGVIAF